MKTRVAALGVGALLLCATCNGEGAGGKGGDGSGETSLSDSTSQEGNGTGTANETTSEGGSSGMTDSTGSGADDLCGNGVIDDGEVCDDGNQEAGDGCSPTCAASEGMVYVSGGPFMMGCAPADTECRPSEEPLHEVTLTGFEIDETEVTADAYQACIDAGVCAVPDTSMFVTCTYDVAGKEDHPANCMSWEMASDYCAWDGKRLPTEAEWEKTARGTDVRIYPWGDAPDANRAVIGGAGLAPVGSKSPEGDSPYGAQDMTGNVFEWVSDWFGEDYYDEPGPWVDPQGPESGYARVVRGGSWDSEFTYGRTSSRADSNSPGDPGTGVRCARTP